MGLIARTVEASGIPTVTISITRDLTEAVGVPRSVFVKWPLGHPLGEANAASQQRTLIYEALHQLVAAQEPGVIHDPGYRWRRANYSEPDWSQL
ncbi:MAG: hypothetical protein KF893_25735 [Caldilineaceae bacterium]|nr:hypothetical protein [Caldilineaceae bacterium]